MGGRRGKAQPSELFVKRVAVVPPPEGLPESHPFDIPAIGTLGERALERPVTVFVGENGTGKSTLLEALAVAVGFNAEGGGRNFTFTTRRSHSELFRHLRVTRSARRPRDGWFLRAESYFNVATTIEQIDDDPDNQGAPGPRIIDYYGGTSLHEQSHGESFFALFLKRFSREGLYLLDEPEAALSPQRQLALLARMHELAGAGSQFIMATHAPILMGYPGAAVWWFDERGITDMPAASTPHWQIVKRFLNDTDGLLGQLFDE